MSLAFVVLTMHDFFSDDFTALKNSDCTICMYLCIYRTKFISRIYDVVQVNSLSLSSRHDELREIVTYSTPYLDRGSLISFVILFRPAQRAMTNKASGRRMETNEGGRNKQAVSMRA